MNVLRCWKNQDVEAVYMFLRRKFLNDSTVTAPPVAGGFRRKEIPARQTQCQPFTSFDAKGCMSSRQNGVEEGYLRDGIRYQGDFYQAAFVVNGVPYKIHARRTIIPCWFNIYQLRVLDDRGVQRAAFIEDFSAVIGDKALMQSALHYLCDPFVGRSLSANK